MFRFPQYRNTAADCRFRIDQIRRIQRCSAGFTLIAISPFILTMRTSTGNITVGKELLSLFIIILLRRLLDKNSLVIQFPEKLGSCFRMNIGRGTGIYVERNSKFFKRFFYYRMIPIDYILRSDTFSFSLQGNRYSMLIRSADMDHLFSFETQISGINISRNIYTGQMPDMHRAVSIRQRCSYESTFEFLFHWFI